MARRRVQADCKADTRGGRWAGIPVCVIQSAAYRDCSVHARAILVELVARMNGYNNGKIALSQRQLVEALGCAPRKVVRGVAELMEHGLLDVPIEGKWKERMAREYRLTFVSNKARSATNDYIHWKPTQISGVTTPVAKVPLSGSDTVPAERAIGSAEVAAQPPLPRNSAISRNEPASEEVSLISKPYVCAASWWTADHTLRTSRAILSLFEQQPFKAAA